MTPHIPSTILHHIYHLLYYTTYIIYYITPHISFTRTVNYIIITGDKLEITYNAYVFITTMCA